MLLDMGLKRIIILKKLGGINHYYWLKCSCNQYEEHNGNNMDTLRVQQRTWNYPIYSEWFVPACSCCDYQTNNDFPMEVIDVERGPGVEGYTNRIRLVLT